jgi:6-phosphogluconolactonase
VQVVNNGKDHFSALGAVSTLPDGFSGTNTTAEIEVSADGRFVYASNRGHDSFAVFKRDAESGALTFLQHAPCGGKTPRHFKIAPGGKWLLCAHMDSNTISVLPLDPETGKLCAPSSTVSSPSPICILFAR